MNTTQPPYRLDGFTALLARIADEAEPTSDWPQAPLTGCSL
jgi:hypothetical protein